MVVVGSWIPFPYQVWDKLSTGWKLGIWPAGGERNLLGQSSRPWWARDRERGILDCHVRLRRTRNDDK